MNENETIVETTENVQTEDAFLSGWNDTEPTVEESNQTTETEEEVEVDNASEETEDATVSTEETKEVAEQAEETTANQQSEKPMTIPADYMGEHKEFTREEATPLIQKGLDYDRIRGKYDEMKPLMNLVNTLAQQSGMKATEYITALRKQVKMAQGADEASAAHEVDVEDREARVAEAEEVAAQRKAAAEKTAKAKADADARVRADAMQFKHDYPNVKMSDVPKEVWDKVKAGSSLVAAYSQHIVSQMEANVAKKEQAAAQNQKNADRAVGSQKSAGQTSKNKDPFLADW